ncbi:cupin domain-containing protein [Leifsonia xyli]|uniref:cupin domain-containing protein n=1 Tax=Leifsonia xyli TaxID=1575 RepID=UPI003D66B063
MSGFQRRCTSSAAPIDHQPVPAEQLLSDAQTTGALELGDVAGVEYGLWEISEGVSTDVEADEVFVVLSGAARIDFPALAESITVGPGDIVRLRAGEHSVWTVTETLRKVYFLG